MARLMNWPVNEVSSRYVFKKNNAQDGDEEERDYCYYYPSVTTTTYDSFHKLTKVHFGGPNLLFCLVVFSIQY